MKRSGPICADRPRSGRSSPACPCRSSGTAAPLPRPGSARRRTGLPASRAATIIGQLVAVLVRRRPRRRRSRTRRRHRARAGGRRPRCAVRACAGRAHRRRARPACTPGGPDHRGGRDLACRPASRRRLSSADATSVSQPHVDAAPLELLPRVPRQPRLEHRQQSIAAFEQHDAHLERRELGILVRAARAARARRARPAYSTPVGPPPTMQNVSSRRRSSASSVAVARSRQSSTWLRSCSASPRSLSPSACRAIVVVAEVVRATAGCEHDSSYGSVAPSASRTTCAVEVDVDDLALAVPHVRRAAEHLAQRRGDLGRAQQAARDLVQQRREQVVVAAGRPARRRRARRGACGRTGARRSRRRR